MLYGSGLIDDKFHIDRSEERRVGKSVEYGGHLLLK